MTTPNWKQLAAIPESVLKSQILKAAGIEPPPEGISSVFRDGPLYVSFHQAHAAGGGGPSSWTVLSVPEHSLRGCIHLDGSKALRATGTVAGTPTGDALRTYMRRWGWLPKSERPSVSPTENTRTII